MFEQRNRQFTYFRLERYRRNWNEKMYWSFISHWYYTFSRIEDHWKTNDLFDFHIFRNTINRNRFTLFLKVIHFCQYPGQNEGPSSRLYKIDKITNYFNKNMEDLYQPLKNLSIDKSMILWRKRFVFCQYIKSKRHKYGIKLYMLSEPWGLFHRILIYS